MEETKTTKKTKKSKPEELKEATENAIRAAEDCVKRLEQEDKADEIAQLQAELKRPDLTAEERNAVLKEITKRIRANK